MEVRQLRGPRQLILTLEMANSRRKVLGILAVFAAIVAAGGGYFAWRGGRSSPAHNAILVIAPYRQHDTWVFDDPAAGLRREPFVSGVPEMIDSLVADIPNADDGFRLLFSAQPFPGYQRQLDWVREEKRGQLVPAIRSPARRLDLPGALQVLHGCAKFALCEGGAARVTVGMSTAIVQWIHHGDTEAPRHSHHSGFGCGFRFEAGGMGESQAISA
jgi:hypothetical protein